MSDYMASGRHSVPEFRGLANVPEALLYGGTPTNSGRILQQRLSYVFLHAYTQSTDTMDGYDTLSEATVSDRLAHQRKLIDAFLSTWYEPDAVNMMLGGEAGAKLRYELVCKKPARALSRLKSKGFYADTYDALISLIDRVCEPSLITSFSSYIAMATGIVWKHANFKLADDVWYSALELTMVLAAPDVYFDPFNDDQWIRHIEPHIPTLLTLVYLISSAGFYSLFCLEHSDMIAQLQSYEILVPQLETGLSVLGDAAVKESNEYKAAMIDKDNVIRQKTKEIFGLSRENDILRNRVAELERQLAVLESSGGVADMVAGDTSDVDVSAGSVSDESDLVELPDDNVLFIGGHPNMLSKLMPLFPKWRFVSTEISPGSLPKDMKPAYIFVWSNHLAHSLFERLKMTYGVDMIGYCKATNIALLIEEMSRLYTKYLKESGD